VGKIWAKQGGQDYGEPFYGEAGGKGTFYFFTPALTISVGPDHQVEVVRHQAPSQDPYRHECTGLLHKFDEPLVVVILLKYILPHVAAVSKRGSKSLRWKLVRFWHSTMLP